MITKHVYTFIGFAGYGECDECDESDYAMLDEYKREDGLTVAFCENCCNKLEQRGVNSWLK